MRKIWAVLLLLRLFMFGQSMSLFAQDEDEDDDPPYNEEIPIDDWDVYRPDFYSRGDQTFTISLGTIFPIIFLNEGKKINHNFSPPVGGTGSLAYTYFFGPNLFLGGEIGFKFNYTLANNVIFIIPMGLRSGWQFVLRRFEIPLYITAGFAPQTYIRLNYAGFFLKGGASVFYRFNPDWSFGLNTDWNWYPQRPREDEIRVPSKDVDANILSLTLSARYHF